jgi:hypothetical protein
VDREAAERTVLSPCRPPTPMHAGSAAVAAE